MQDTFDVEDELLSQHYEDVGVIYHVGDEDQHIDIGSNFGSMHSSGSCVEDMEVGEDVRDIYYSGVDVQSTKVDEKIDGTQHIPSNINIITCHMVADVNAI